MRIAFNELVSRRRLGWQTAGARAGYLFRPEGE